MLISFLMPNKVDESDCIKTLNHFELNLNFPMSCFLSLSVCMCVVVFHHTGSFAPLTIFPTYLFFCLKCADVWSAAVCYRGGGVRGGRGAGHHAGPGQHGDGSAGQILDLYLRRHVFLCQLRGNHRHVQDHLHDDVPLMRGALSGIRTHNTGLVLEHIYI